jgi:hypothetical protein
MTLSDVNFYLLIQRPENAAIGFDWLIFFADHHANVKTTLFVN